MHHINISPLSSNKAYVGRRWQTPAFVYYKNKLFELIPRITFPEGKVKVSYVFGISKGQDVDNLIKHFQDSLIERSTNLMSDASIYEINARKVKVEKGCEFIEFKVEEYHEDSNNAR